MATELGGRTTNCAQLVVYTVVQHFSATSFAIAPSCA